jgi:hypothetical protein
MKDDGKLDSSPVRIEVDQQDVRFTAIIATTISATIARFRSDRISEIVKGSGARSFGKVVTVWVFRTSS